MEEWFTHIIRQLMLYSLPLLITLTSVALFEHHFFNKSNRITFNIGSITVWLPLMASILFSRAIIFALPQQTGNGVRFALVRLLAHTLLCGTGLILYIWASAHSPAFGLPPLHFWWAKVLMYLNLCLMALHLLPLPHFVLGELILKVYRRSFVADMLRNFPHITVVSLSIIAASPLLDMFLGAAVIFPIYEQLASFAE